MAVDFGGTDSFLARDPSRQGGGWPFHLFHFSDGIGGLVLSGPSCSYTVPSCRVHIPVPFVQHHCCP